MWPAWRFARTGGILGTMGGGNVDLIRSIYGIDWASTGERQRGLSMSADVVMPNVEAHVSPELGERTLAGLEGFAVFVEGLEQDFSEFRYVADEVREFAPDQVVVLGHIRARGRTSRMPLTAPFRHLWSLKDGHAVSVYAHLRMDEPAVEAPTAES